jgi:hypothetical protein
MIIFLLVDDPISFNTYQSAPSGKGRAALGGTITKKSYNDVFPYAVDI